MRICASRKTLEQRSYGCRGRAWPKLSQNSLMRNSLRKLCLDVPRLGDGSDISTFPRSTSFCVTLRRWTYISLRRNPTDRHGRTQTHSGGGRRIADHARAEDFAFEPWI